MLCTYQWPALGADPRVAPGEPTGLEGDLQQKFAPDTGALECFRLFSELPGDLPTEFANALLCHVRSSGN